MSELAIAIAGQRKLTARLHELEVELAAPGGPRTKTEIRAELAGITAARMRQRKLIKELGGKDVQQHSLWAKAVFALYGQEAVKACYAWMKEQQRLKRLQDAGKDGRK